MVTNNKVLTVSYGTFSCTLEGFDDSFDTMKAIAEYFRDLAADDRYFGAEPPTPDAEMLTRIAEREIERRVQARHEAGAIVLSATPNMAKVQTSEPAAAPEVTPETDPKPDAGTSPQPETAEADTPQAAAIEETVAVEVADLEDKILEDTDTNDLDLSALVSDAIVEDTLEDTLEDSPALDDVTEPAVEAIVEDEIVAEAAEEFFAESEAEEIDDALVEDLPPAIEDEDEDTINLFDDAISEAQSETPADDDAVEEEDSIAAKLRRIRAVVSRAEAAEDDDEDYIEDQHAEDSAPVDQPAEIAVADAVEDIVKPAPKPRARVIRMKRAQLEDSPVEDDVQDTPFPADMPETSSLSSDDEADLMAELAEVDAELATEDQVFDPEIDSAIAAPETMEAAEEDNRQARERRRERRAKLDTEVPGDEAVDRLIDEANTKLDEPEGNRRRSAIAHLRAAVAATKAEKEAGKSFEKEDQSDAYRQDLADTVRPRGDKPAKAAPPLKLVAEQRIDTTEAAEVSVEEPTNGIRPRRVSVEDIAAAEANEASSNFVEFAENMGATQLPDIMEAAASYLTFVEGRKRFSRPMLMRLAYQMGESRFQREAGLRSFGQLLRDNKIEKVAGGRFTVSDAINFKPDDRAAG